MLTKTKIVLVTTLLLGSASVALADDGFDPNLGNRYPAYNEPIGTQRATARTQRGFVQAPATLLRAGPRASINSGYHPNADFRYGPQIDFPQSPGGGGW